MQGAAREDHAIFGLMREFYPLGGTGKDHTVLTHNGSATQGGITDVTGLTSTSVAVTASDGMFVERNTASFRSRPPEHQRGPRRRIDLLVVMHLQNFDIE